MTVLATAFRLVGPELSSLGIGWVARFFWWFGIGVFVLVVVPAVVLIANRVVSATRQIRLYAQDAAQHASSIDLAPLTAGLERTRELVGQSATRAPRRGPVRG